MQQFKPLKEWTKEEIQNWFNSFENGLFKEYATKFAKCNGNNMYGFNITTFKEACGPVDGQILFDEIQKLKKGK